MARRGKNNKRDIVLPQELKIHIFMLTSIKCSCYDICSDDDIFNDFLKISHHVLKISENSSKLVQRSHKCCIIFFKNL